MCASFHDIPKELPIAEPILSFNYKSAAFFVNRPDSRGQNDRQTNTSFKWRTALPRTRDGSRFLPFRQRDAGVLTQKMRHISNRNLAQQPNWVFRREAGKCSIALHPVKVSWFGKLIRCLTASFSYELYDYFTYINFNYAYGIHRQIIWHTLYVYLMKYMTRQWSRRVQYVSTWFAAFVEHCGWSLVKHLVQSFTEHVTVAHTALLATGGSSPSQGAAFP